MTDITKIITQLRDSREFVVHGESCHDIVNFLRGLGLGYDTQTADHIFTTRFTNGIVRIEV
jgi:hypothetical protein